MSEIKGVNVFQLSGPVYVMTPDGEKFPLSEQGKVTALSVIKSTDVQQALYGTSELGSFKFRRDDYDIELEAILTGRWTWRQVLDNSLRLSAFLEHERRNWHKLPVLWERKV